MPEVIETVNSIFEQPWWLDAVAPGSWNSVEIAKEGVIFARLPYMRTIRRGLTYLSMPPLTQTLGPWIKLTEAKYSTTLAQQKELMTALIKELPSYDYFLQNFHCSVTNFLPFYWKGFKQTTRCTYVIKDLTDRPRLWAGLQSNIRREIRKAEKQVIVHGGTDIEAFIDINELTFERQGETSPFNRELVRRLDKECAARNARRIFFASDAQGRIHAAAYIVWDENSAYYLMGGGNPELRTSGATSLVMWEAIKFAAEVTRRFDFEGSMLESVERFFRAFGAEQVSYLQVSHMSRRMKLLQTGKELVKAIAE